jgi:CxxC motif-containing protein (DUF1111 family)
MASQQATRNLWTATVIAAGATFLSTLAIAQGPPPVDPGRRTGAAGAGGAIAGLTVKEAKFFDGGLDEFTEIASVTGSVPGTEPGLGPRFNMTGCATCHAQPAVGGTSPAVNPQVDPSINPADAAQINALTSSGILSIDGPVREVRFGGFPDSDGGVHQLFTIAGLPGTPAGCTITPVNFSAHVAELQFRIPTPTFGLGLVEAIEDATIIANQANTSFGISGRVNRNGNDGTVTRFGWKAQNKSLVIFSGEAYNVEQGITNELFPDERGEGGVPDPAACRQIVLAPQDAGHYELTQPLKVIDNVNAFANFMRFLAAPVEASTGYRTATKTVTQASILAGEAVFNTIGCGACHKPTMQTGNHLTAALRFKTVRLFSDLLLHEIGTEDGISQGVADGTEFRTAPLWGLGQRLFFLHDGRTGDLLRAIAEHDGAEPAIVIGNFNALSNAAKQDLLNFLRSL